MIRKSLIIAGILLMSLPLRAQFYDAGNDPASVRYRQVRTKDFNVIYPAGADSLALRYALEMQRQSPRVGYSIGYEPDGLCRKPVPVVLRCFTAEGNGMMMMGPRRLEMFTVGDALSPDPMPWLDNLAIHETRHTAQLQFTRQGRFRIPHFIFGDISDVAWWAMYPSIAYAEGDAVTAETALSRFGRGRTADFLEYVRASFDEGDFRDFYRWRYGSNRYFTPDHYRAGYMLVSGMRYVWDDPLFSARCYDNIFASKALLPFSILRKTIRQNGEKNLNSAWDEITHTFSDIWEADRQERGPFIQGERLTSTPDRFESFSGAVAYGDDIYAIREGIADGRRLVRISPDGNVKVLSPWAAYSSNLKCSDGILYWSERKADLRWGLKSDSVIMSLDLNGGGRKTLLSGGRYFNPAPSPDGEYLSVSGYAMDGSTSVLVISSEDGSISETLDAPAGMQVVESAWIGGDIFVSAITGDGFGIYNASRGFCTVLPGIPAKIKQLQSLGDALYLTCDRNGVNELYRWQGGEVARLTSTRNGADQFLFDKDGENLRYAVLERDGRSFFNVKTSSLKEYDTEWTECFKHPVAERLSSQEDRTLGLLLPDEEIEISDPEPYNKLSHAFKIHSWAPFYVDYEEIESMSFESISTAAGLGASVFFQNDLATSSGYAAYNASYSKALGGWSHAAHIQFDWKGWYPIFETTLDISGNAAQYQYLSFRGLNAYAVKGSGLDVPSINWGAKVYVPLNLSSGGWSRGIVPQLRYNISNNFYDTSVILLDQIGSGMYSFAGCEPGGNVLMRRVSASLRGYTMLPVAPSGIYPRLGIGAEAGISARPQMSSVYTPGAYAYIYGYVPGLYKTHGIRLSVTGQKLLNWNDSRIGENTVSTAPRGMSDVPALSRRIAAEYPLQMLLSAEYKMPVLPLDWSGLGALAYVRNLELGVHYDCSLLSGNGSNGMLTSAGASLAVRLGNLLWLPFDTRIGFTASFNGGSVFDRFTSEGLNMDKCYIGGIFSVDI